MDRRGPGARSQLRSGPMLPQPQAGGPEPDAPTGRVTTIVVPASGALSALDRPAVGLDDRLGDRQSEPRAAGIALTRSVAAVQPLEDQLQVLGWDPGPVVLYAELHAARRPAARRARSGRRAARAGGHSPADSPAPAPSALHPRSPAADPALPRPPTRSRQPSLPVDMRRRCASAAPRARPACAPARAHRRRPATACAGRRSGAPGAPPRHA